MATDESRRREWVKCAKSPAYFLDHYVFIYNATERAWIPFDLWPAQVDVIGDVELRRQLIVLKARQLGITWLCLGYALWLMLFRPVATVLLFSLRDDEAMELLKRLKGMYVHLPVWMQARGVVQSNDHAWLLTNGSVARAFPTTGGRSYTGTFVLVDEADFIPDLSAFLNAVKPTVDAGGQIALVSTADKKQPESTFKRLFRAAWRGMNEYTSIFLPWWSRPDRNQAWYERIARDMKEQDGSDDNLWQEYPATVDQALAPNTLDKRIPPVWIQAVYAEASALPFQFWRPGSGMGREDPTHAPTINGLEVYKAPAQGKVYVIGLDPAEGNPTSDDSALTVLDSANGEEVAALSGKFQPSVIASLADLIGAWYNGADVMVERNNHGHSVVLWFQENSRLRLLNGMDGKPGWLSNVKGKSLLYDAVADYCRDGLIVVHSGKAADQLSSIEGATLRAPEGMNDDRADSFGLAVVGIEYGSLNAKSSVPSAAPADPVAEADRARW